MRGRKVCMGEGLLPQPPREDCNILAMQHAHICISCMVSDCRPACLGASGDSSSYNHASAPLAKSHERPAHQGCSARVHHECISTDSIMVQILTVALSINHTIPYH